ncbi:hypothetical protein [Asanoa siamensis]|uniref:Lipoprotein n=1 Tax=Asanoa siamensis TaxID=926357 RepID=A0ABQ4CYT8_9ACTN|nr:hypothetical protein [Asanoa siamensis]GIF76450.1 hypothetical protein Asi02nite_59680 [Asanoa siamensis]
MERGRRARHRRRAVVAGSTLAVLALATAGVATVARPGPASHGTVASSPQLKLASAFATSTDISYRVRLTTGAAGGGGDLTYEGAFDPTTDTGYVEVTLDDSVQTELLVDGTRYTGGERLPGPLPSDKQGPGETYGRYGQYPGTHDRLSLYAEPGSVLGAATPDPAALYAFLQTANATVTENSDGTLHFTLETRHADGSNSTSGDVTLDADGRIGKVTITDTWRTTLKGNASGTSVSTLVLFDYGVEATVERPTDVVPAT